MPNLNITLHHNSGAVTGYKHGDPSKGGVHEAILVCMDREQAATYPLGVVRADLDGSIWARLVEANAVQAIEVAMISSAQQVLNGFIPKVYLDIDSDGVITGARLIGTESEAKVEEGKVGVRSLQVPQNLPYQLGGDQDGASILLYKALDLRGIRIHSIHPTAHEAAVAEQNLKAEKDVESAIVKASTPVTRIVNAIVNGQRIEVPAAAGQAASATPTAFPGDVAGHVRTSLAAPSPFTGA